jgi:hypothetical protein
MRKLSAALVVLLLILGAINAFSGKSSHADLSRHFVTDVTEHKYFLSDKCDESTLTDSKFVVQWERHGKPYWHPVKAIQFGFQCLARFEKSGDEIYLEKAKVILKELTTQANVPGSDSLLIEYELNFALHGDNANTTHGPWRSAMAQGQAVSLSI